MEYLIQRVPARASPSQYNDVQRKDLTGKKFGTLTVVRDVGNNRHGKAIFECECTCGGPNINVVGTHLRREHTTSCGRCERYELPGKRFGKLTVIRFVRRDKYSNAYFECRCDCGRPAFLVAGHRLKQGQISCGRCEQYELPGKKFGRYTVIKFVKRRRRSNAYFECRCDCGNITAEVSGDALKRGRSTQCHDCANKTRDLRIGLNELALLDAQEKTDRCKIDRDFTIVGYKPDGYCHETNTIYEVYEKFHDKQVFEDLIREERICKHLGCDFVIIHDRTH